MIEETPSAAAAGEGAARGRRRRGRGRGGAAVKLPKEEIEALFEANLKVLAKGADKDDEGGGRGRGRRRRGRAGRAAQEAAGGAAVGQPVADHRRPVLSFEDEQRLDNERRACQ